MLGLALIIDRTWLETAKLELRTAAEAAALAAGVELANDVQLIPNITVDFRLNNARRAAESIASQNFVGGVPVTLNTDAEGDIRFGNLVQEPQGIQFVESEANPNTVVVTALRTRSNNNPVALFLSGIIGLPFGDVAVRVEASINNDVIGLRPIVGSPVPALPLAVWEIDPTGIRTDTWDNMVSAKKGADQYTFDPETHSVIAGPDGIPEMVIHSLGNGVSSTTPNVQLLDLGTQLRDSEMARQFQSGVTVTDLQYLGGEVLVGQGTTAIFNSSPQFTAAQFNSFRDLIGEPRICFLYSTASTQPQSPNSTTTCTQVVSIRVMSVITQSDGSCLVTIQPTVMTSRTVMLASEPTPAATGTDSLTNMFATKVSNSFTYDAATSMANSQSTTVTNAIPNQYLYKLRLTH